MVKFRCDCGMHILEISFTKPNKKYSFIDMWFGIYDIYSPKTGKKYKKPKLIADTIIMNNKYPKELTKLLKWFPLDYYFKEIK